MCIIIAKEKGLELPTNQTLQSCFISNPDGAGIMYNEGGKVVIEKGFMEWEKFSKRIEKLRPTLKEKGVVLHFRIATEGGISKQNCHPFPITPYEKILEKLHLERDLAVAHNGMIDIRTRNKKLSDTMEYILTFLSPMYSLDKKFYLSKEVQYSIENYTKSKFAFLDGEGNITTLGKDWVSDEALFSNSSYIEWDYKSWDYSFNNYNYSTALMQEVDESYSIIDDKGKVITDNFEFYYDVNGIVYEVDYYSYTARKKKGYRVFDTDNKVPILDYKNAEWVAVEV